MDKLREIILKMYQGVKERIETRCKYCGGRRVVKFGHFRGVQRWWCKDCKRKFVDNKALPNMKTPIVQVALALSMFYEGMSLNGIRRNLEQTYGNYPSDAASLYRIKLPGAID